jgi:hypothetical protein
MLDSVVRAERAVIDGEIVSAAIGIADGRIRSITEDGADVICLGCAGLAGVYAPGPENPRTCWPLSSALRLDT